MYEVIHADVLEWAVGYSGQRFHAVLCDAPYHLTTITKRFGKQGSAAAQYGADGAFQRVSGGFMGQEWDGSLVSFRPETWAAVGAHLHPGGFLMTFAGSRTYHRIACALEDAGFIIHPAVFHLQAQGFPKATRIDVQVDRDAGAEREVIGENPNHRSVSGVNYEGIYAGGNTGSPVITAPATDLARTWAGHRYGLQALKPCAEFICVAQKPYEGRPVACITETGAGALWVDGGRLGHNEPTQHTKRTSDKFSGNDYNAGRPGHFREGDDLASASPSGRWPPNVALSHHPQCTCTGTRQVKGDPRGNCSGNRPGGFANVGAAKGDAEPNARVYGNETVSAWDCHPACPLRRLDDEVGQSKSHRAPRGGTSPNPMSWGDARADGQIVAGYADRGGPSRFYFNADWSYEIEEQLANLALPALYCPKAGRKERDAGLDEFQTGRSDYRLNDPDENTIRQRLHGSVSRHNSHPTVKPLKLCIWLATLMLPPPEYAPRRILVPFAGTGSEMIGCLLAGWEEVVGVEISADYCALAEARLAHWAAQPHQRELTL